MVSLIIPCYNAEKYIGRCLDRRAYICGICK